jgi:hypothetical protein
MNNDMNLKTLIEMSTRLAIPFILIALTIILRVYGLFLAMRLRRKEPTNAT